MKSENITIITETWRHANAYLVHGEKDYLIDPSISYDPDLCPDLAVILATHAHFDHIAELDAWREQTGKPFWLGAPDAPLLEDERGNASSLFGTPQRFAPADRLLADGDRIELDAGLILDVFLLPGHTPGSSFYLFSRKEAEEPVSEAKPFALFTGDVIFASSIGRTDLLYGDSHAMNESLTKAKQLLASLPADCPLYAGHDRPTTVGACLQGNPYLQHHSDLFGF